MVNRWSKAVRSSMTSLPWWIPTGSNLSEMEMLFRDTRGRWLYNEHQQNDIRYTPFDVKELVRVACRAMGAHSCTLLTKLDGDTYNKAFRLTLDNSLTVIVRLPCPVAGPSYLVTASEVATLEFAREVLKLPVPRVITWSREKRSHSINPVGADYIIMEEVPGTNLDKRWKKFDSADDVAPVMTGISDVEARFESLRFSRIGSLYFKEDVSANLHNVSLFSGAVNETSRRLSEKYCVGPLINDQLWRGERAHMALDRGPWPDATSFFVAAAKNEQSVLEHFPSSSLYRRKPACDPETHSNLLSMYIRSIPHILPTNDDACAPTLWHPGFTLHNLFVSATGPGNLLGIVGWQHTAILPYFCFASIPPALVYHGSKISMENPYPGPMPANLEELSLDEQAEYRLQLRLAYRQRFYQAVALLNPRRQEVCALPHIHELMMLPSYVVRSGAFGVFELRQALLYLRQNWAQIACSGTPCPIEFSEEEMAEHARQWKRFQRGENTVGVLLEAFQCEDDGWVPHENYDGVRETCNMLEETWDEELRGTPFPFKDGEYSYFLS